MKIPHVAAFYLSSFKVWEIIGKKPVGLLFVLRLPFLWLSFPRFHTKTNSRNKIALMHREKFRTKIRNVIRDKAEINDVFRQNYNFSITIRH